MAELLAPGVYVQETSFRAKPIEGVSTSTAAFVGMTRRGPVVRPGGELPELLTTVGDFERIYGATSDLELSSGRALNYVAHAVRAYFDNGGRRLYVARVHEALPGNDGIAVSRWIVGDGTSSPRARFVARAPGRYGNGSIQLTLVASPAAPASMERAPTGTLLQTGGDAVAQPAQVQGGIAPFRLQHGARLQLGGSASATITFEGRAAEARAATALPATVELTAETNTVTVSVGGVPQLVTLPAEDTPREEVLSSINAQLRGAYARLDGEVLVLGTDVRGTSAQISVSAAPALGFDESTTGTPLGASNVADLSAVTADEVAALLAAASPAFEVSVSPTTSRLSIRTLATGASATITVGNAEPSAAAALGLGTPTPGADGATRAFYVKRGAQWLDAQDAPIPDSPAGGMQFLSMNVTVSDADGLEQIFENVAFSPEHPRYLGHLLAPEPTRGLDRLENGFAFAVEGEIDGLAVRAGLFGSATGARIGLTGGDDGAPASPARFAEALGLLRALENISTVAAPGSSSLPEHVAIRDALLTHVEALRAYRIAVLDVPPDQTIGEMRADRSQFDSKYAALYAPWLYVSNPDQRPGDERVPREIKLPPSGFVCGIYARNDSERGVFKAPANEPVRGAIRLETNIDLGQQEVLNPDGINAIRFFPGRGIRVWGARLASSDPEWNYVNLRRYFNYVEASIDRGTQWAVFEPNGPLLWRRIRESVTSFLQAEWSSGALLGNSASEAFFVRCDRSTMTQRDLDTGRLICEVGIAVVRPAEFVVFRIGQATSQARG